MSFTEIASAKLNLFLHITDKRADGYHLLDSLFVFTEGGDQLIYEATAEPLTLSLSGPFAEALSASGPTEENLVLRAGRMLADKANCSAAGHLTLQKTLPIASGIGGGSADAAAALRLLTRAWQVSLPQTEMLELCLKLGADVPPCYVNVPRHVAGIGEILRPVQALPEVPVLLINPGVAVSTPEIFETRQPVFSAPISHIPPHTTADSLAAWLKPLKNDLTGAAIKLAPVIGEILDALETTDSCLLARMSGSGATCFGLYPTKRSRDLAKQQIAEQFPRAWILAETLKKFP